MASNKVTGKPRAKIEEMREEYSSGNFEKKHCLAPINKQPDHYDGPQRFCSIKHSVYEIGSVTRCKFHGGKNELHTENLDKLAPMKHGMKALRKHLVEDFDDKDQALYDWIIDSYAESYDLDLQGDPNTALDLHQFAAEVVRAERGRGYLIQEGEVTEKEVRDEEGRIVVDENGDVVTEKSQHYLADMINSQDKKLLRMERELALTRKEQNKQESADDAVEAIKNFSELGTAFLSRNEQEYSPDDSPWEEDDE